MNDDTYRSEPFVSPVGVWALIVISIAIPFALLNCYIYFDLERLKEEEIMIESCRVNTPYNHDKCVKYGYCLPEYERDCLNGSLE